MDLTIEQVAYLLNVSVTTVRRWVTDGKIPTYSINQNHFFSRTEIENWVISHKLDKTHGNSPFLRLREIDAVSFSTPQTPIRNGNKQFSLFRAVHKGDVLHQVKGETKEEIIRNVMQKTAGILNVDAEVMTDLLLDREHLMPTSLNNGIAVPHTRDSLLNAHHDAVIIVFPDKPLDYGALDGKHVHILFFLFACTDISHLHLLAKIAHLSNQNHILEFFQSKPSKKKILHFLKEWEANIPQVNS